MRARRALLYAPGSDIRKMEKAASLDVDSVCLDLEDGVATNRKAEARAIVAEKLRALNFGRSERLARINAIGSGLEADDLAAILPARPDGIVIPKITTDEEIQWVSAEIANFENEHGLDFGAIYLLAMIETARGVINLSQIAGADSRLQALIFGSEDFAADIGATRTSDGAEILYARSAVLTHAAAFELDAIDYLTVDFRDLDALREAARDGARMGFAGKQIIHPNQIAPVQEAFTPDEDSITHAQRVVQAAREYQNAGAGAFALDGKMVDMPIVKGAERMLARARAAGKLVEG